tara:strand:- start:395 stop:577 length:183 start_codon:yes stop_codon:yes gene_type:complete
LLAHHQVMQEVVPAIYLLEDLLAQVVELLQIIQEISLTVAGITSLTTRLTDGNKNNYKNF